MFEELQLSSLVLCYGPLLLVVGGFIAFAIYTDGLARKTYLRNTDPRPDDEREHTEPIVHSHEMVAATPSGFLVAIEPDVVEAEAETSEEDDLKLIEGIGPKIASILNDAGIKTFAQLSNKSVEELQAILDESSIAANLVDCSTWPNQATLAANEEWEALEELQEKLNAGRDN